MSFTSDFHCYESINPLSTFPCSQNVLIIANINVLISRCNLWNCIIDISVSIANCLRIFTFISHYQTSLPSVWSMHSLAMRQDSCKDCLIFWCQLPKSMRPGARFTNGLWAYDSNLVENKLYSNIKKWLSHQVITLHMPWQLSCHGMCKFMTW